MAQLWFRTGSVERPLAQLQYGKTWQERYRV
jgi:hypothetical protein